MILPILALSLAFQSGPAPFWSGAWAGVARQDGDTARFALVLEPAAGGRAIIRMTIAAIHVQGSAIGPVSVDVRGDSVLMGPFRFRYDRGRGTLSTILPSALVPVYRLPVTFHRVDGIEVSTRPPLDAREAVPRWVFDAGSALWPGVTFSAGLVYAGGDDGVLHALDARTGRERWRFQAGGALRARPTAADDAVYFQADDGVLYRLSARDGTVRWHTRVAKTPVERVPLDQPGSRYDVFGSDVAVDGDRLFLGTADGRLLAVDAETGAPVWTFAAGDAVVAAPAVVGDRVVFGSFDHRVYALDRETGEALWSRDTGAPVVSTPAIADGRVIVGSRSYDLLALDLRTGALEWKRYVWFSWIESSVSIQGHVGYVGSSDAAAVLAFDVRDGTLVWRSDVFGRAWGRPAVGADRVYVGTSGVTGYLSELRGGVVALDRRTGRPVWRFALAETDSRPYGIAGSVALGAALVFAAGLDGRVYAFSP